MTLAPTGEWTRKSEEFLDLIQYCSGKFLLIFQQYYTLYHICERPQKCLHYRHWMRQEMLKCESDMLEVSFHRMLKKVMNDEL